MRPENLNFLFKTITTLPGIGPKLEVLFNKLTGKKNCSPTLASSLQYHRKKNA